MNYDICDPSIRCNADKAGASVFLIERGNGTCRVLAFNQIDAELLAEEHLQHERPAVQEASLFEGF